MSACVVLRGWSCPVRVATPAFTSKPMERDHVSRFGLTLSPRGALRLLSLVYNDPAREAQVRASLGHVSVDSRCRRK